LRRLRLTQNVISYTPTMSIKVSYLHDNNVSHSSFVHFAASGEAHETRLQLLMGNSENRNNLFNAKINDSTTYITLKNDCAR